MYIGYGKVFKRNNDVKKYHYLVAVVVTLCFFYLVDRDQIRVEVRKKNANPKETTESIDDKFFKTIRIIIIIIVVR